MVSFRVHPVETLPVTTLLATTLLATTTAEAVGVVAAVVAAAVVGALVGAVVTRRRRPPTGAAPTDAALADARIAALWAGTRPDPTPAAPPSPPLLLTLSVWRLRSDQVLGLVLDALGDLGFSLVEVHGDRAVLTTSPTHPGGTGAAATAVATYGPTVPIDDTGQGLQVRIELSGPGAPGLGAALRRRLVVAAPTAGPVGLLEDPALSARPGAPRR